MSLRSLDPARRAPARGRIRTVGLLIAAVIALPCIAWYVSGSRAVRQDQRELLAAPLAAADDEAQSLARQLAARLEALRRAEAARPFHEYAVDVDVFPEGCVTPLAGESPLTTEPADPLIWTHFQVDEVGQLSLPGLDGRADEDEYRTMQEELDCTVVPRVQATRDARSGRRLQVGDQVVVVEPFVWETLEIAGAPARVALRELRTSEATFMQGFVVRRQEMQATLASRYPVELRPGEASGPGEARLPIDGAPWHVRVDPSSQLAAARLAADGLATGFHLRFAGAVLIAAIAGAAVLLLVVQTERSGRERARFAAAAAHELRTPLAAMRLHAELLADDARLPDPLDDRARTIAEEADRLGRVVANVLGYSRMEHGGLVLHPEPGDLAEAVRTAVERLRPGLEEKGVRLELALPDDPEPARFDRDGLDQILANLLDNAERYSRGARNRTVQIRVDRGSEGPVLAVVDHGSGVAPEIREHLFEPFARTEDPDAPAGLGIGLALVKALADGQSARVDWADLEGARTEFSVRFRPA